jgi:ectoine hydroxylase-related dioxygenase (phytanoyl-CoA dioxygenase family)
MSLTLQRFSVENLSSIREYYLEHGFVIVKDAFSENLLKNFALEYSQLVKINLEKSGSKFDGKHSDKNFISEGIKTLEAINHSWVSDIYDTSAMLPSFLEIVRNPSTLLIIKFLLEIDTPLYPYTNRIRIDPPSDNRRTYGWHQETFYTIPRSSFVQTWAPLIYDVRVENGTISVADGSQKEGIPFQTWSDVPGGATQILISDTIIDKYEQIAIEMNVGELLFFSGRLAHKSGNNISEMVRFSLVGMYHDISNKNFIAPSIQFDHKHQDPKSYFEEEMRKIDVK